MRFSAIILGGLLILPACTASQRGPGGGDGSNPTDSGLDGGGDGGAAADASDATGDGDAGDTDTVDGGASDGEMPDTAGGGGDGSPRDAGGTSDGGGAGDDASGALSVPGVWQVEGSDGTGAYSGHIELTNAGGSYAFTRVIRYIGSSVEDGRELWWVFSGTAVSSGRSGLELTASLKKADFIASRDGLARTSADRAPVVVTGTFTAGGSGFTGSFVGPDLLASESWTNRADSRTPIFSSERLLVPAHDPPSAAQKAFFFQTFESFHALPAVAPYVSHLDFQAAVHGYTIDRTDAQFYRDHPNALRVVQKVVDPISLQETLSRANAFRYTLAAKAGFFDTDTRRFVEPVSGMLSRGSSGGALEPSGDGALWTGVYVASQAYRYQVTGEVSALANVAQSLDALLVLKEITGDPAAFARTLLPIADWPASDPEWHAGTGALSHLAWKEGGNNDMLKGLLYGYLTGYLVLCGGPGYEALCGRIRTNAAALAGVDVTQERGLNSLTSEWLAAYVNQSEQHRSSAALAWTAHDNTIATGNAMTYSQGIADWSGTHLNAVQYTVLLLLAQSYDISENVDRGEEQAIRDGILAAYTRVAAQRLVPWHLLYAAFVLGADPAAAGDARLRLRELPAPKTQAHVDHTIGADFVLSPYPAVPWKLDWTTTDRTQALRGRPIFEQPSSDYFWKENPLFYRGGGTDRDWPAADYLHAYWMGRRFGVIAASE